MRFAKLLLYFGYCSIGSVLLLLFFNPANYASVAQRAVLNEYNNIYCLKPEEARKDPIRHSAMAAVMSRLTIKADLGNLALLEYAPLQQIALQRNFDWHRTSRERIVARVEAGELKPNVDYNKNLIALGDTEANVSVGGNDIVVDQAGKGSYVLFLTSRGLKHHFSGFLHVPDGADPNDFFEFDDKPPSRLVRYDKDWYFVAN